MNATIEVHDENSLYPMIIVRRTGATKTIPSNRKILSVHVTEIAAKLAALGYRVTIN